MTFLKSLASATRAIRLADIFKTGTILFHEQYRPVDQGRANTTSR
jgi:hypothetical protein